MTTIKCGKCGTVLKENLKFCPSCGASSRLAKKVEESPKEEPNNNVVDIIIMVILALFTLSVFNNIITFLGMGENAFKLTNILNLLTSILLALSLWGTFMFYKTDNKLFALLSGIFIIVGIFFYGIENVMHMIDYTGFTFKVIKNIFLGLVNYFSPVAILYLIVVGKIKKVQ